MTALSIVLDIVLILISLVLIVSVLMQEGQRQGLGAISGGADTFFGKGKAKGIEAKLSKITKIATVAFIVLAIAATIVVSHNTPAAPTVDVDETVEDVAEDTEDETADDTADSTDAEADTTDAEADTADDAADSTDADTDAAEDTPVEDAEVIGEADGEADIVVADGEDAAE